MKKILFILFVFTTFFISCKKEITIENLMLVAENDFEHIESHQFTSENGGDRPLEVRGLSPTHIPFPRGLSPLLLMLLRGLSPPNLTWPQGSVPFVSP